MTSKRKWYHINAFYVYKKMKFSSHEKDRKNFQLFSIEFWRTKKMKTEVEKPRKREKHVFKPFGKHDKAFILECLS